MTEPAGPADRAGLTARRIMVDGVTGSGKTTTARRLAGQTGLPWYAVDDLTWDADWTPVSPDEQRRRIGLICARDAWIIDHGYGAWLDLPLARAELVVALDLPRWRSFAQLLRRSVSNIVLRRPTCNGNIETWRLTFASRDSILVWHARSWARKRERIRSWMADPAIPRVVRLTHPREIDAWLRSVRQN